MSNLEESLLPFANLKKANFSGQDFSGSDLRGADFTEATMVSTNFRCCSLGGSNFTNCDLRNADLRKADLQGAIMKGADLRGADLTGANLRGVDFYECDVLINRANLYGVKGLEYWQLKEAIFNPRWIPTLLFGIIIGAVIASATLSPVSIDSTRPTFSEYKNP